MLIHKNILKDLRNVENALWDGSFGFKLHLIINDKGKIFNFMFTLGNCGWPGTVKAG